MKQFELKGLGLEEMSHDEQFAQDGGLTIIGYSPIIYTVVVEFVQGVVDGIKKGYNKDN